MNNNFDDVYKDLKAYLKIIRKENYEAFIINLIKTCTIEKDNLYPKILTILTIMGLGNYTFDKSNYIQSLGNLLPENESEMAMSYLSAVLANNKLSPDKVKSYGIDKSLKYFEIKEIKIKEEEELKKYLKPMCEKISEENVMVLLDPMNDDQINSTIKFIEHYTNIQANVINYEGEKRIYLKYYVKMNKYQLFDLFIAIRKSVEEKNILK